ncbi:hypothetical protein M422DRAFT_245287 [Sphaerobolus stellatus SS14]|nr:hypothetical protein M422DRAFT_245287 [Sphaerobolus stellatus SS14]
MTQNYNLGNPPYRTKWRFSWVLSASADTALENRTIPSSSSILPFPPNLQTRTTDLGKGCLRCTRPRFGTDRHQAFGITRVACIACPVGYEIEGIIWAFGSFWPQMPQRKLPGTQLSTEVEFCPAWHIYIQLAAHLYVRTFLTFVYCLFLVPSPPTTSTYYLPGGALPYNISGALIDTDLAQNWQRYIGTSSCRLDNVAPLGNINPVEITVHFPTPKASSTPLFMEDFNLDIPRRAPYPLSILNPSVVDNDLLSPTSSISSGPSSSASGSSYVSPTPSTSVKHVLFQREELSDAELAHQRQESHVCLQLAGLHFAATSSVAQDTRACAQAAFVGSWESMGLQLRDDLLKRETQQAPLQDGFEKIGPLLRPREGLFAK